jgi:hypothetical protein
LRTGAEENIWIWGKEQDTGEDCVMRSSITSAHQQILLGRDLDCMADVVMEFHLSTFSKPNTEFNSDLAPCDFWALPIMKRELRGKKFRSDQRSAARFRGEGVGAL